MQAKVLKLIGFFSMINYIMAIDLSLVLGSTHWSPCYSVNKSRPSLLEGADLITSMGSKVFKGPLFAPKNNYPWNSPLWPVDTSYGSSINVAKHPYFDELFRNPKLKVFVLVVYRAAKWSNNNYWISGVSAADYAAEEKEFYDLTLYLLKTHAVNGKTFILEHWEGDWSMGLNYNSTNDPTETAINGMISWLQARQNGVTKARNQWKLEGGNTALGNVFHAAEVNLVLQCVRKTCKKMVQSVIPKVALDMVSYSAYDSQKSAANLKDSLQEITNRHNRTAASPPAPAVFIAEWGAAQSRWTLNDVKLLTANVIDVSIAFGAKYVLFWETFCNECNTGATGCVNNRCSTGVPITEKNNLAGFWLQLPDGSFSYPYAEMKSRIASSIETTNGLPLYSQCGGVAWTGGTVCCCNAECVVQNTFYSQCIPKN